MGHLVKQGGSRWAAHLLPWIGWYAPQLLVFWEKWSVIVQGTCWTLWPTTGKKARDNSVLFIYSWAPKGAVWPGALMGFFECGFRESSGGFIQGKDAIGVREILVWEWRRVCVCVLKNSDQAAQLLKRGMKGIWRLYVLPWKIKPSSLDTHPMAYSKLLTRWPAKFYSTFLITGSFWNHELIFN